jgi:hypothetical protein
MMRLGSTPFVIAMLGVWGMSASAAGYPPHSLFAGTMNGSAVFVNATNTDCQIDGPLLSTFLRNNGGPAEISFPTLKYDLNGSNATTWYLGGVAVFTFSTATGGKIAFTVPATSSPPPASVTNPPFAQYKQSYNVTSGLITISFTINFPACSMPVQATYRAF